MAAVKICRICYVLTKGSKFQRKHMQFIIQYIKQKSGKIDKLTAELRAAKASQDAQDKSAEQEELLKQKKVKLAFIIDYALNIMQTLSCNVQAPNQKACDATSSNRFEQQRLEESSKTYEFDAEQRAPCIEEQKGPKCQNFDSSNPFEYCHDCSQQFNSSKKLQNLLALKQSQESGKEGQLSCKNYFYFSGSKSGLEYNMGGLRNMQRSNQ